MKMEKKMDYSLSVLTKPIDELKHSLEEYFELMVKERRARLKAESDSRQKDAFFAAVSHELRSPLHSIKGWLGMLRDGKLDESGTLRAIDAIERSIKLQTKLVEDLFDLAQIANGKLRLNLELIEIAPLVENILYDMQPMAAAKDIKIISLIKSDLGCLKVDSERLKQALINLLSNAVKFTSDEGNIRVYASRTASGIELKISDDGRGIGAGFLPFVFEEFSQAEAHGYERQPGVGLGLFITRQIVEVHGGRINVESDGIGKGATFIISLPRAFCAERTSGRNYKPLPYF